VVFSFFFLYLPESVMLAIAITFAFTRAIASPPPRPHRAFSSNPNTVLLTLPCFPSASRTAALSLSSPTSIA
jgi:hypothetical protein